MVKILAKILAIEVVYVILVLNARRATRSSLRTNVGIPFGVAIVSLDKVEVQPINLDP
jgi:hypothetical protein